MTDKDNADARRYRAFRDGEVIVSGAAPYGGGWSVRHKDAPGLRSESWHWNQSLDEAIDAALKRDPL